MQNLISNPKNVLDYIGWHSARANRDPQKVPFLFMQDGEDYYCLKVSGDSMMGENIEDQDLVMVKRTEHVKNGDIIVGVLDGEPLLRKYTKVGNVIELHSASSGEKPIRVTDENDFRVAGVFVGHFNE